MWTDVWFEMISKQITPFLSSWPWIMKKIEIQLYTFSIERYKFEIILILDGVPFTISLEINVTSLALTRICVFDNSPCLPDVKIQISWKSWHLHKLLKSEINLKFLKEMSDLKGYVYLFYLVYVLCYLLFGF